MTETTVDLAAPATQEAFGMLVGISQPAVSDLVARGVLETGQPIGAWLAAYCGRLRAQASGRDAEGNLAKERAALSRSQRLGQDIKNAIAQGEYAPIGLLGDVLAIASAAVVDRFDALPGVLRKACPDLPAPARDAIARTIAAARNEWIRSTADLVVRSLDELAPSITPADDDTPDFDDEAPTA